MLTFSNRGVSTFVSINLHGGWTFAAFILSSLLLSAILAYLSEKGKQLMVTQKEHEKQHAQSEDLLNVNKHTKRWQCQGSNISYSSCFDIKHNIAICFLHYWQNVFLLGWYVHEKEYFTSENGRLICQYA